MTPKPNRSEVEFLHNQPQSFPQKTHNNVSNGKVKNEKVNGEIKNANKISSKYLETFSNLLFWGERHNDKLEKWMSKYPTFVGSFVASLAMFILGITARGEWVIFAVYFAKYLQTGGSDTYVEESDELISSVSEWFSIRFKGYLGILIPSTIVSYLMYFGIGGYLHWYYYVRQRKNPETWKCQPEKWLSPELERHEIMVGSISLVFGSSISAAIACYVKNGGWSTIYFQVSDYGYLWLVIQVPLCYIMQDYLTYWHHRMYHTPWLYKTFHKLHHTYKQPTAFSVTAIHPIEFMHMQFVMMSPMFTFPVYWLTFSIGLIYIYYHGIVDHSGINFKRHWWQPWQPDCIFHDNHHQYFHVNFGFNCELWDKLHGTYRRKDRIYHEDIYFGYGKPLDEASPEELQQDLLERKSENHLAYQGNQRHFDLDEADVIKQTKLKKTL